MSRSNNNDLINPCTRWFEWGGASGLVSYYDADAKKDVEMPLPFTFIVLDNLSSVKGWHDASESGIYSNEVRNTTTDILTVRSFKGGPIAEGIYSEIKEKVSANGGHFVKSVYICFKENNVYHIGNIRFKGAALHSWSDFYKKNRQATMKGAVSITGFEEGKKGSVTFKTPTFTIKPIKEDTNQVAVDLDIELQEFLTAYLAKGKSIPAPPQPEAETKLTHQGDS